VRAFVTGCSQCFEEPNSGGRIEELLRLQRERACFLKAECVQQYASDEILLPSAFFTASNPSILLLSKIHPPTCANWTLPQTYKLAARLVIKFGKTGDCKLNTTKAPDKLQKLTKSEEGEQKTQKYRAKATPKAQGKTN
jgi:hypothetical protein